MADSSDAVVAEITAQRVAIAPQVRGMDLMMSDAKVSAEMRAEVQIVHDARTHRDHLCMAAVDALNALKADGYPALPSVQIQNSLLAEMQEENADLDAALAVFSQQPAIAISPTPTFTTQPAPTSPGPSLSAVGTA